MREIKAFESWVLYEDTEKSTKEILRCVLKDIKRRGRDEYRIAWDTRTQQFRYSTDIEILWGEFPKTLEAVESIFKQMFEENKTPDNVSNMCEYSNDSKHIDVPGILRIALEDTQAGKPLQDKNKVLILALNDEEDEYSIAYRNSGMTLPECIALIETAKTLFLNRMGYLEQ